ncbi:MAG: hypothetical protein ACRCYQ_14080 [Nocardioides sp.]
MFDEPIFWIVLTTIFWWIVGWLYWRGWRRSSGAELESLRYHYAERDREATELAAANAQQLQRLAAVDTEVKTHHDHAAQLTSQIREIDADRTKLQEASERYRVAAEAATRELDASRTETERHRATAAEAAQHLESARTEVDQHRAASAEAQRLATMHGDAVSDLQARLSAAEQAGEVAGLREQLAQRDDELVELRSRLEVAQSPVVQSPVAQSPVSQPPVVESPSPISPFAGVGLEPDPAPAVEVDTGDAQEPDDLKKIFGIGPKLSALLNGKGIYHFRQIAAWTVDDIRRFDEELPEFHGRIERDGWIASAREEHEKKYGGSPSSDA